MAEGVGKVMKILSRVTIPDGAGSETAAEKAKDKPGEKLAPKKGAGATCGEGWTEAFWRELH